MLLKHLLLKHLLLKHLLLKHLLLKHLLLKHLLLSATTTPKGHTVLRHHRKINETQLICTT